MYVRDITIGRFRHLHDVRLGPLSTPPKQSDLVVLAGPNGGGKSSILELLGYALSNTWSLNWSIGRSFPESSFEVTLGLTPEEVSLVRESTTARESSALLNYAQVLEERPYVYRSFNFPNGEHAKDPNTQNHIYSLVVQILKEQYLHSLGFFLRADRNYPNRGFDRGSIFNYQSTRQRTHAWTLAYGPSETQYSDMHDFIVQQRYHYFSELGAYEHRRRLGLSVPTVAPTDPLMPYDELLQKLFPDYRFSDQGGEIPTALMIDLPGGISLPFNDLSSGEKEVFFVLSFFLRHDVTNAVILIDEPELYLHPELARRLIDTMMQIRPGNQVWAATHNAEIIDEAGRDRVVYITRDATTRRAKVTPASDEPEAVNLLRDLFGYSGYIGVARTMVFLEGLESSADRKIFTPLIPLVPGGIKLIPAGGVDSQTRLNAAILQILEATWSFTRFYLIRDRDFLTDEMAAGYKSHASGRVHVLGRYHIENYLLLPELFESVLRDIYGIDRSAQQVMDDLKDCAKAMTGEVLANMLGFRMNLLLRPQDFSLGGAMRGQPIVGSDGSQTADRVSTLRRLFGSRVSEVEAQLASHMAPGSLDELFDACLVSIVSSLDDETWRDLFPGRRLIEEFCKRHSVGKALVFQNSLIKELGARPELMPSELARVFSAISRSESFDVKK